MVTGLEAAINHPRPLATPAIKGPLTVPLATVHQRLGHECAGRQVMEVPRSLERPHKMKGGRQARPITHACARGARVTHTHGAHAHAHTPARTQSSLEFLQLQVCCQGDGDESTEVAAKLAALGDDQVTFSP